MIHLVSFSFMRCPMVQPDYVSVRQMYNLNQHVQLNLTNNHCYVIKYFYVYQHVYLPNRKQLDALEHWKASHLNKLFKMGLTLTQ